MPIQNNEYWTNLKVGVATRNLAVREEPNSQSKKVGYHYKGETFFIESTEPVNGWYRIVWADSKDKDPEYGYVYGKFIKGIGSVTDQKNESDTMESVSELTYEQYTDQERTMVDDIHDVVHKTEEKLNSGDLEHNSNKNMKPKKKIGIFERLIKKLFGID